MDRKCFLSVIELQRSVTSMRISPGTAAVDKLIFEVNCEERHVHFEKNNSFLFVRIADFCEIIDEI